MGPLHFNKELRYGHTVFLVGNIEMGTLYVNMELRYGHTVFQQGIKKILRIKKKNLKKHETLLST